MKNLTTILICLISTATYSQEVQYYKLLNIADSLPVENAYITVDNWLNTLSDSSGNFKIDKKFKTIQISHIAFLPYIASKNDIINKKYIFLKENTQNLEEVHITNKKTKEQLLPSNDTSFRLSSKKYHKVNENSLYATYIENSIIKDCYINKIIIETGIEPNYKSAFRVNLYSVDKITQLPHKRILKESILTYSSNDDNKNTINIDISDFMINFPKEGIYVVVESLNLLELEKINNPNLTSPSFRAIKKNKNNSSSITYDKIFSWNRLTRSKDIVIKDWIDESIPNINFVFNFGIEIEY